MPRSSHSARRQAHVERSSASVGLTRRARPPTGADRAQTAARQSRRLSNGRATARPHRSPSLLRNASTRWYSPARPSFGSHEHMSQRLPYPRTNSPWTVSAEAPPRLGRVRRRIPGGGVGDVDVWLDPLHAPHPGGHDGVGRFKVRILVAHREVVAEHREEAAVMGGRPVPGRPSPCSTMRSRARLAASRSVMGPRSGQPKVVSSAW
jgi:hypothetical protein